MILKSFREQLTATANQLLTYAGKEKIFLLEGPMGAGKTTLIKALCEALGTVDIVKSPTFTLLNEYQTREGGLIYHFDCYRMHNLHDAVVLDFESYFFSGHYCFIEWPSKIKPILPLHYFLIDLTIETATCRNLIYRSY